jgi:hypothetical protein
MSASSAGYLALLLSLALPIVTAGCGRAAKHEVRKPIITVCSGCGTEWESMGPGQPKPITTCPNCPMTPEEFERLKEEMRKRKDEAR